MAMDDFRKTSPFASMSGGGGGGGAPELNAKFPNNFLAEQPVVFGSSSAGSTPFVTAAGAAKRGRERSRSQSPNVKPMGANHYGGHQDAFQAFGNTPDQQSEEEAAKARRLLRFGTEFGTRPKAARSTSIADDEEASISIVSAAGTVPEPSGSRGLSASQAKLRDNAQAGRNEALVEPPVEADMPDNLTSEPILGICPDMCPEMERNERERKGDLDKFERLGGNRSQTARDLAVKKYTRTAEKDAVLIRPLPVLKKTMDYLLRLLERDHEDDLLAVHSFLWDRMRAVRMDLRMQHIFTEEAITMHEQMIRFHILAMHELCEYSQGEGISEVFNAHLNIEQMNKTSVDLFQMYEDHAKRGTSVLSEAEFRGYYALLKLDKHPGYRVEPAELSLDLAKMTPEIRNSQQVRFARDVARACRTSNYVAFFSLAREATYLQACLMHAHFSKLRMEALASLHSALQKNQGFPLSTIVDWLGMEGEDTEALIKFHGFSIKYYEEAYMVKEGPFLNKNQTFSTCRAQLVEAKRSLRIVMDVQPERQWDTTTQTLREVKRTGSTVRVGTIGRNGHPGAEEPSILFPLGTVVDTKEEEMPDYVEEPVEEEYEEIEVERVAPVLKEVKNLVEDEGKQGKKRPMEELQFEAEEHERRRLRHEADAVARRAASQAAAAETKREEELLRRAGHTAEANAGRQSSWFRKWRRRAAAKALERHQRLLATQAAMDALSLGYPLWKMRVLGESLSLSQRNEYTNSLVEEQGLSLQQMWQPLDIPSLVGPILQGLNPGAGFLYWKLFISTVGNPIGQWVRTKVTGQSPTGQSSGNHNESNISLAEESVLMTGNNNCSIVEFQYVIKDLGSSDAILQSKVLLHDTGGLAFVTNEDQSVAMEQTRLHSFVQALPEGANVPLLILSTKSRLDQTSIEGKSTEQENWDQLLNFGALRTSKIKSYRIVSLVESSGSNLGAKGYYSDAALREGLEWLAKLCPIQPHLRSLHVADLVREHVDTHMKLLLRLPLPEVNPNLCIKLFNQGLQNAGEEIVSIDPGFSKNLLPSGFMYALENGNDEGKGLIRPRQSWKSKEALDAVLSDLKSCYLPLFPLNPALSSGSIGLQKLKLEQTLLQFLSLIYGSRPHNVVNKWEVSRMVQRGCTVEWYESGRQLVPKWALIFQAIFAARLLLLDSKPLPRVYIARIDKTLLQLVEFGDDTDKSQLVTSPDFSCDGQLLLDDLIGEDLYKHVSPERESLSLGEEIWTKVTDAVSPAPMQVNDISHPTENGAYEKQRDGALECLLQKVEEHRSKSLQLALTESERSLDKSLAELKQWEHGPVEIEQLRKPDQLNSWPGLSFVIRDSLEPELTSYKQVSEKEVPNKWLGEAPDSLQEASQVSGQKFLLASSPFEVLLDKMLTESSMRACNEQSLVDMVTPNRSLYLGIKGHRIKYQELRTSSWSV